MVLNVSSSIVLENEVVTLNATVHPNNSSAYTSSTNQSSFYYIFQYYDTENPTGKEMDCGYSTNITYKWPSHGIVQCLVLLLMQTNESEVNVLACNSQRIRVAGTAMLQHVWCVDLTTAICNALNNFVTENVILKMDPDLSKLLVMAVEVLFLTHSFMW